MIGHNTYFNGAVQSLEFRAGGRRATVGVMSAGTFEFTTASLERVTLITGSLEIQYPGPEWTRVPELGYYEVPARWTFRVHVEQAVSYLCEFLDE